ncbi:MAG: hypothetical protein LBI49_21465 [Nocardiopsaceae bacterium]|jgi:hypothetical protein|nr:hypothetical protein [Nocardiopsaceae bacterium]
MSMGGDPERGDEFGLPPVDIKIPDDASELDRDVQAYHRELRALRRRKLARRLSAPLTRHGLLLPLLASCLALTLLAGTLLTLLSASQGSWLPASPLPRAEASSPAPAPSTPAGRPGQPLPGGSIVAGGQLKSLSTLSGTVLALVPRLCRCTRDLRQLARQAAASDVRLYLVGIYGDKTGPLTRRAGLRDARAAADTGGTLTDTYRPGGLTAILVRSTGVVDTVVPAPVGGFRLSKAIGALRTAGPAGLPGRA